MFDGRGPGLVRAVSRDMACLVASVASALLPVGLDFSFAESAARVLFLVTWLAVVVALVSSWTVI